MGVDIRFWPSTTGGYGRTRINIVRISALIYLDLNMTITSGKKSLVAVGGVSAN